MTKRILLSIVLLAVLSYGVLYLLGSGLLGEDMRAGHPTQSPIPARVTRDRSDGQSRAARAAGVNEPRQILFGDLHVHTTFSVDAFMMSLPMSGGDGARPVSDACDFARYCSALDFWSINDHALALTPRRWNETVRAVRECNEVSGNPEEPDVAAFLGWEWTQVGSTPETHYGHKNVVLRHLDDERIPRRPISAGLPRGATTQSAPSAAAMGLLAVAEPSSGLEIVRYFRELLDADACPLGVPVRELPDDCIERADTPQQLFEKLDDWGHEAIVIPHGTTWGYYTPLGSSWDKQLTRVMHDPQRQTLIEIYSGHGNSEEYRDWREIAIDAGGNRSCPEPRDDYLPSCWQAGEIIRSRCLAAGESEDECEHRAEIARDHYLVGDNLGHHAVPGGVARVWDDSGLCRDCFLPALNYRPRSSVQYIMALSRDVPGSQPNRFRFGFLSSSDNHSARPGTGYKEYGRSRMTEARFGNIRDGILGMRDDRDPAPNSEEPEALDANQFFGILETERQASFFLTGGLVAAHARGRSRDAIWEALERREVYGTSGPRILLWFDLVNPPGPPERELPMGSSVKLSRTAEAPIFRVRAVGSLEQHPGCPDYASAALPADALERLCGGECYHPSNKRRLITRIEVVRIRPQLHPDEPIAGLIDDPWRVIPCAPDPAGCEVGFSDPELVRRGRDALYYVRAIEEKSLAVNAENVRCQDVPLDDDCLGETQERAWSSPIFVDVSIASHESVEPHELVMPARDSRSAP